MAELYRHCWPDCWGDSCCSNPAKRRRTGQPCRAGATASVPLDVFNSGEIRVKAGELTALRLANSSAAGHSFDVDELNVHVAIPSDSESLALFTAATPGTYTFYCAPHYDKASGTGMHGTLIVEP